MSKGKTTKTKHKKRTKGQIVKLSLQLFVFVFLTLCVVLMGVFYIKYGKTIFRLQSQAKELVRESTTDTFRASQTSLVYDSDGELISTLKTEKEVYYLGIDEIPSEVMDAMIVTEDKKFFKHSGVDYIANIRAAIALIKNKGEITQGASTITQQLARNIFLSNEVSYKRKIEEIFIAQELEKKYTKLQIMEFYLNNIYFANGYYGIQAASNGYFSKNVSQLSLSQIAFLCSIPNNPNLYNPVTNMENTLKRRDRVLEQMFHDGKIDEQAYEDALSEKIKLKQNKEKKQNYIETYIYHCAIEALMVKQGFTLRYQFESDEDKKAYEEDYNGLYNECQHELYVSGYRIYTSIDRKKQKLLQKAVDDALKNYDEVSEEGVYKLQGAAVCIDNDNGKVVAIVGGRSQKLNGYTLNRGYQSFRQPGSAIKPLIVYTPEFERNYYPNSIVKDEKFKGGPSNSDKTYSGEMKLKRAIELSKNTVAWKLFEELTPKVGLSYLLNMNFSKINESDYNPAAAIGGFTIGVSPVEMTAAYAAIENDGFYREPTCIVKIMDADGNEVLGNNTSAKQIYQTDASRIMTEVLTGVMKDGTGKGLGLSNTICAGKTGTTNDKKDGWFAGYTPYYTTCVWVGYDMPKTMSDLYGNTYPGTIWHDYMEQIHDKSMTDTFKTYDWKAVLKEKGNKEAVIEVPNEEEATEEVILPEEGTADDSGTSEENKDNESNNPDGQSDEDIDYTQDPDPEENTDILDQVGDSSDYQEDTSDTDFGYEPTTDQNMDSEDNTGDSGIEEPSDGSDNSSGMDAGNEADPGNATEESVPVN